MGSANHSFDEHGVSHHVPFDASTYERESKEALAFLAKLKKSDMAARGNSAVLGAILELEDAIFRVRMSPYYGENPQLVTKCPSCGGLGVSPQHGQECYDCSGGGIVRRA